MQNQLNTNGMKKPFPALTPAQRWHLEVHGYVVVEKVFNENEVGLMFDALQKLKRDFYARDDPWSKEPVQNCTMYHSDGQLGKHHHFNHLLEADPVFLEYSTHPRIVGMCEEVVGNSVRINETQAAINCRTPGDTCDGPGRYLWHRHRPEIINYTFNGLFHCHFVKAITNLTDLGPDDGGTCVIAGCHKATCREEGIVQAARDDPSLIHKVIAPAGSTLIFCEALLHSTGDIRSDKERTIIITGYMPHNGQYQGVFNPGFEEQVPKHLKNLVFGSFGSAMLRRRTLEMEVGKGDPGGYTDGWSLNSADPKSMDVGEMSWQGAVEMIG